jgi:LacI family transcriptional regulator
VAVTLQHIADRVGVSAPTVSQILSPTSKRAGLFADSTRDRVRKAADELGYRANAAARSTATGRFGAVTLLLSQHDNRSQLPPRLLDGIDEALAGLGLHLMVARLPDAKLTDADAMPKLLRELTSDGLLINYNAHIPPRMIDLIRQYSLPSVWINSKHEHNCVYPDDEQAGYDATRLLLDAGHTRVAFVDYTYGPSPKRCHYSNTDRRAGYRRAMDEAGLEPRLICGDDNIRLENRIPFTRDWLDADDCPTAVVCYTHHESTAILVACDRTGRRVPDDLSITVVHDEPVTHYDVRVPTAKLPEREIGKQAVAMLHQRIQHPSRAAEPVVVPLDFLQTEHVARLPVS